VPRSLSRSTSSPPSEAVINDRPMPKHERMIAIRAGGVLLLSCLGSRGQRPCRSHPSSIVSMAEAAITVRAGSSLGETVKEISTGLPCFRSRRVQRVPPDDFCADIAIPPLGRGVSADHDALQGFVDGHVIRRLHNRRQEGARGHTRGIYIKNNHNQSSIELGDSGTRGPLPRKGGGCGSWDGRRLRTPGLGTRRLKALEGSWSLSSAGLCPKSHKLE
jgi:hypothetical protein